VQAEKLKTAAADAPFLTLLCGKFTSLQTNLKGLYVYPAKLLDSLDLSGYSLNSLTFPAALPLSVYDSD
jgi:hypothetical protein